MLTMDDIKYIKRMYECEGISIREIMRRTGYHYETVKKYMSAANNNKSEVFIIPELENIFDKVTVFAKYRYEININERRQCEKFIRNAISISELTTNSLWELEGMERRIYLIRYLNCAENLEMENIIQEISSFHVNSQINIEKLLEDYYEKNHKRNDLNNIQKLKRSIA